MEKLQPDMITLDTNHFSIMDKESKVLGTGRVVGV
jgi:hypothetical protein